MSEKQQPAEEREEDIVSRLVEAAGSAFLQLSQRDCERIQIMSAAFQNFTAPLSAAIRDPDASTDIRKVYAALAIWTSLEYLLSGDDMPSMRQLEQRAIHQTEKRFQNIAPAKSTQRRKPRK